MTNTHYPVVMTIAGSDSGGGAGIQADLKTFMSLKTFGTSALTAVTVQNTLGVHGIQPMDLEIISGQINHVASDFEIQAVKTGMLHDSQVIQTVAEAIKQNNLQTRLVIDPVMIAKGGASLLLEEAQNTLRTQLLPLGKVITPNIPEAEVLSGIAITNDHERQQAAEKLLAFGVEAVVIKGGHRYSKDNLAEDYFLNQQGKTFTLASPRIETPHTHGTGCTFSAAITAFLAKGLSVEEAVYHAKAYIHAAISHTLGIGHGHGPTNHWAYAKDPQAALKEVTIHE
ncbi:bifunctional hydroxymethylpyrimidine kinase/phosphomethylpyrimidine kinase [Globicatella sulfidifaciens]|nr:bifunctional hydroxymethylpyrimidine kinase/phosphomethylpyrimidine kinase [Globicatella sulfidifaciens]